MELELTNSLNDQSDAIAAIEGVSASFHAPEPNNFVFILLAKKLNPESFTHSWGELTSSMNDADSALLRFCCDYLDQNPDLYSLLLAQKWHSCIQEKRNLQAEHWSRLLINNIETNNLVDISFSSYLQKSASGKKVLDAFLNIPDELLSIARINIYIEQDDIHSFIKDLLSQKQFGEITDFVDRIEVAKQLTAEPQSSENSFPKVILYLSPLFSEDRQRFLQWLKALETQLLAVRQPVAARTEYASVWTQNSTITEGFTLYKRYLSKLGLLNTIYTKASNYGMTRDSKLESFIQASQIN